ncbi:MAG: hypothetical protein CSA66_02935 [Proteobacteria bacterium]|nr:MAG: hypothetical protein CSA66_02935 [Pseudomonadota bacterium]
MPRATLRPLLLTAALVLAAIACGGVPQPTVRDPSDLVARLLDSLVRSDRAALQPLLPTAAELPEGYPVAAIREEIVAGWVESAEVARGLDPVALQLSGLAANKHAEAGAGLDGLTVRATVTAGQARARLSVSAVTTPRGLVLAAPPTLVREAAEVTAAKILLRHGVEALGLVDAHAAAPPEAARAVKALLERHGDAIDAARASVRAALDQGGGADPEAALARLSEALPELSTFAALRARVAGTEAGKDSRVQQLLTRFQVAP